MAMLVLKYIHPYYRHAIENKQIENVQISASVKPKLLLFRCSVVHSRMVDRKFRIDNKIRKSADELHAEQSTKWQQCAEAEDNLNN